MVMITYGVVDCQTGTGGRSFGRGEVSRGEVSPGKSSNSAQRCLNADRESSDGLISLSL